MTLHALAIEENLPNMVAEIEDYPGAFAVHDWLLSKKMAGELLANFGCVNAATLNAKLTLATLCHSTSAMKLYLPGLASHADSKARA